MRRATAPKRISTVADSESRDFAGVSAWKTFHTVECRPNFETNSIVCFPTSWWESEKTSC
jgi:hypothetical protein